MKILSRTKATAGVTSEPPTGRHRLVNPRRVAVAGLVATSVVASTVIGAGVASAAPPAFPDNLVVFPNRDFVTVEGYQNHIGETALLEVKREGKVIGSAQAQVAAGDVAFEVNHPGGACWGAGTDLKVTPDILPGDVVALSFNGVSAGDTKVQDAFVTGSTLTGGTTLKVAGHIGAGVNQSQLEQRIVNPDLTATDVNRRDTRAVPGPLTAAPKGGYLSQLVVTGDTFEATYNFNTAATATIAANGGGERMMAWEVQDAAGNRQGLTIAELGELGGPGMGGCPAGAVQVGPVGPTNVTAVRSTDKTSVKLGWTPAAGVPGTAAITGYRATAVGAKITGKEQTELGRRIADAAATGTTITGLDPADNYTFEVRSTSSVGETFPPSTPTSSGTVGDDVTPPTVTAVVNGTSITFSSNEPTASIYFTTSTAPGGLDVFTSGGATLDPTATLFKAGTPVPVPPAGTTLKFAAVDLSGNVSVPVGGTVFGGGGTTSPVPAAITTVTGTGGQGSVSLGWASTDTTITGYTVKRYTALSPVTAPTGIASPDTTAKSLTVTGLTTGTPYWFTVTAKNANGAGPESARFGPFTPTAVTDQVTVQTGRWKAGDFRVIGVTSAPPGTVLTVRRGAANGPSLGTVTVTAAVAPATLNDFNLRLRNGAAPATNPGTIYVTGGNGGVGGPFTVTNG